MRFASAPKIEAETDLEARAIADYLGLAIGDALGATVEFMTPREIQVKYGTHKDIVGGGWLNLVKGRVTDDTEMALALGTSILTHLHVDPKGAAEAFSDWMATKPVDVGHTVRRGILNYRQTGATAIAEDPQSAGNGACMRCLPVALFTLGAPWKAVKKANAVQSHVTHNAPLADAGTETVIAMVHAGLTAKPLVVGFDFAAELAETHPPYAAKRRIESPSGFIVETLQAVFQAFKDGDGFEGCLIDVVNRGGDADTTGAIAGMIAGAFYGLDAIPERWIKALDPQVRDACIDQARALIKLCPAWLHYKA